MRSNENYFKVFQSWNVRGWYQWYWSLHQPSGHMYHISQGFDSFELCMYSLKETGEEWLEDLTK